MFYWRVLRCCREALCRVVRLIVAEWWRALCCFDAESWDDVSCYDVEACGGLS